MNSEKSTISVRFRSDFAEILEVRAWYEGSRLGTLTNRLVRSELQKVSRVGEKYIISKGSAEYDENGSSHSWMNRTISYQRLMKSYPSCRPTKVDEEQS